MLRLAQRGRAVCVDASKARRPCKGEAMGSDYSALFYVLVAIIFIVKFYVGSCGCS
jgi:hypothetical protein